MAGVVVIYFSRLGTPMLTHEKVTLETIAKAIAQPKHYPIVRYTLSPERSAGLLENRPVVSHCHQFILALHEKL